MERQVLTPAAFELIRLEVQPPLLPKVLVSPFQILCRQQTGRENLPLRRFTVVPHSQIVWERLYLEHIKQRYIASFFKPYTVICTALPRHGIDNLARNICSEVRLEFYEWQGRHVTVYFPSQEICPSQCIRLLLSLFTDSKYGERKFTYHTKGMSVLYKLAFHLSSLNIGFVHYATLSSCTCVTEYPHYVVLASCLVRKNEFFKKCIHTYSAVALLGLARIEAKGGKMRDTE